MKRVLTVLLLAVLLAGCWTPDDNDLLDRVNRYRTELGLPTVDRSDTLHDIACKRAGDLLAAGTIKHGTQADAVASMAEYGPWRWMGEDLAVDTSTSNVFAAFVASPTHRAVLIDERWTRAGICVLHSTGAIWVVARFTD